MKSIPVYVDNMVIENELLYNGEPVLHYKIQYPQFTCKYYQKILKKINLYYKTEALMLKNAYENKLYEEAVSYYKDTILNEFPFHMYEAVKNYEITFNQDCTLSLFFDKYEYTGGAHGNTVRNSDTWNIQNGNRILLSQNFAYMLNYRAYVIDMIYKQISEQISSGNNIYFDNYHQLVIKSFNEDSYYLNNDGIIIYYQQYDIAPYASGIPEFLIPYNNDIVKHPICKY